MRYAIVIEKTSTGFSAYVPDLPGWISVGAARQELEQNIREAMELYLDESGPGFGCDVHRDLAG